jgi:hypothetical protein
MMSVVTGLRVVNRGDLVLLPARAISFTLLQTMPKGYGAHTAYYLMRKVG